MAKSLEDMTTVIRGSVPPAPTSAKAISAKLTRACLSTKTRNVTANARACGQVLKLSAKHIIGKLGDFSGNLYYPFPPLELYRVFTGLSRLCGNFLTFFAFLRDFATKME